MSLVESTGEDVLISYRTIPETYKVSQAIATRSGEETYDGGELPPAVVVGNGGGGSSGGGGGGYSGGGSSGGGYSGGGSSGGGGGGSAQPKTPASRTDCPQSATANSTSINSVLSNETTSTSLQKVKPYINTLRQYATNQPNEYGLTVSYANGHYYVYNQNIGSNPTYIVSGTPNSLNIATTITTYLIAHTHPTGQNAAPSPLDAITLANNYCNNNSPNITANVIFAANGSEYMIYVTDRDYLDSFCSNSGNSDFFENNGAFFKSGSVWQTTYNAAYNKLISNNYTQNDAQSYALSYVLDHYNTGLKIYEKKSGTTDFKEQKTIKTGSNYSPQICP
jgi:hypothetical protein